MPNGETLAEHPRRSFAFGYGSIPLLMACAAVGAGLHVVALWIENEAHISTVAILICLAVPVGVFCVGVIAMNGYLARGDGKSARLATALGAAAVPLVVALVLDVVGAPLMLCVVVVCLIPVLPVIVLEAIGD